MTKTTRKQTSKNTSTAWKRTDDYIQFNPPRNHPSYDEWVKLKKGKSK